MSINQYIPANLTGYHKCNHGIYDASVCYYCSPPSKEIKEFADARHQKSIEEIIPYPSETGTGIFVSEDFDE